MIFRLLAVCTLSISAQGAHFNDNEISASRYLPYCKFDENIISNDELLKIAVDNSNVVFSGKVSSDLKLLDNNKTISFRVVVKRFFKGDLKPFGSEVTVTKSLHHGEGVQCRQVIRLRYTAIFIAHKVVNDTNVNVNLTINPVSITLNNLERINSATKGKMLFFDVT